MLKSDIPILSKAQIAQVVDRQEEVFHVPEWGGAIKLKAWSTAQRDQVVSLLTHHGHLDQAGKLIIDNQRLMRLLCVHGVIDPVLTEDDIAEKSPAIIDRIATQVMRLNAMNKEAALTASMTFRPDAGAGVPVPAGEGSGENAATAPS